MLFLVLGVTSRSSCPWLQPVQCFHHISCFYFYTKYSQKHILHIKGLLKFSTLHVLSVKSCLLAANLNKDGLTEPWVGHVLFLWHLLIFSTTQGSTTTLCCFSFKRSNRSLKDKQNKTKACWSESTHPALHSGLCSEFHAACDHSLHLALFRSVNRFPLSLISFEQAAAFCLHRAQVIVCSAF